MEMNFTLTYSYTPTYYIGHVEITREDYQKLRCGVIEIEELMEKYNYDINTGRAKEQNTLEIDNKEVA